jgi:hypothetical protein
MNRTKRWVAVAAAGAATLTLAAPLGTTAASAVGVPGSLKVARTGDGTDLAITWRAVPDVDHYTVSVFDGTTDHVRTVPGDKLTLTHDGSGVCTRYRVKVSAVGRDGSIATTNNYLVGSLAPGGVSKLSANRSELGAAANVAWGAPSTSLAAPATSYKVLVRNMGTGDVILNKSMTDTSVMLTSLDARRQYSVKVTPVNAAGSCTTSTTVLHGSKPSTPTALTVERDASTPSKLNVSWTKPAWSGYGPITHYELGIGDLRITKWVKVTDTSYALTMDPNVNHVFAVRAISSDDIGTTTKPVVLARYGAPGTPVIDPKVTVEETGGVVTTQVSGPVGTSAAYPKMRVSIDPTIKGAWRDEHVVSNGATSVIFTQVPCGVFTVVVSGFGAGTEKEFARKVLNRCDVGTIPANLWKVVYGAAEISGNDVAVTTAGERRIMSTLKRTTQDMVFTTTAHLKSGWGYGIWARADVSAGGAAVSGYSMQYDPGYANVNPGFGKALLLRLWSKGSECGTPLAKVPFPAGVGVYDPHRFTVVVKGDTLFATIDDKVVFNVPSLAAAVKANGCGMPAPTGTEIGFRTWNTSTATFSGTTLN